MSYWKISPHHGDGDYALIPADCESDHRKALEYACDRLEQLWDNIDDDEPVSVTIELCSGEMPELDLEDDQ